MSYIKRWYFALLDQFNNSEDQEEREAARQTLIRVFNEPLALYGISDVLDCVASYMLFGLVVLPQLAGEKRPPMAWKKFQKQPPSVQECYDWWVHDFPNAGVLAVLGKVSGVVAIDVDGQEACDALLDLVGTLPAAPMVKSGNPDPARFHLFFEHPDISLKATSRPVHPQMELKADRSQIILPPSLHKSGNRYAWVEGKRLGSIALPPLPEQILATLKRDPPSSPEARQGVPVQIPKGRLNGISNATREFLSGKHANGPQWSMKLFAAGCDMNGCGFSRPIAEQMLLKGAQPWNECELASAIAIIESAFSEPRQSAREYARSHSRPVLPPNLHPDIVERIQRSRNGGGTNG